MAVPVTLEDARRQLRLAPDDTSQDDELQGFIADAEAWVESYTGHVLIARDVTETFAAFDQIAFRAWPIAASAVPIVTYAAGSVAAGQVTDVRPQVTRRPVKVIPWIGSSWPRVSPDSVTVTIRAGYGVDDRVPGELRRAMLVLIAAYDADREGGELFQKAEATARRLCRDLRIGGL